MQIGFKINIKIIPFYFQKLKYPKYHFFIVIIFSLRDLITRLTLPLSLHLRFAQVKGHYHTTLSTSMICPLPITHRCSLVCPTSNYHPFTHHGNSCQATFNPKTRSCIITAVAGGWLSECLWWECTNTSLVTASSQALRGLSFSLP